MPSVSSPLGLRPMTLVPSKLKGRFVEGLHVRQSRDGKAARVKELRMRVQHSAMRVPCTRT